MSAGAQRIQRELSRLREDPAGETEALLRRAFWRVAGRYTPYLAVERDGLSLLVSTRDQVLSRRLFVYADQPEEDIREAFAALRSVPAITERLSGRGIVEIGANLGTSTVEMLVNFDVADVLAIEPSPENCVLLRHNALANGVQDRVRLLAVALSDHEGEMVLEISPTNAGDHRVRVSSAPTGSHEDARATIPIRVTSFDTLVADRTIDLEATGAIWMDAQGHEGHILSGAQRLLESDVPILTEYWPYGLRRADGWDRFHTLVSRHYEHALVIGPTAGDAPGELIRTESLADYGRRRGWDTEMGGADLLLSRHLGLDFTAD